MTRINSEWNNDWTPSERYDRVEVMSKYNVGDDVMLIKETPEFEVGTVLEVVDLIDDDVIAVSDNFITINIEDYKVSLVKRYNE